MKLRTLATLTACCVALVQPLRAADLQQLITDAAKYESDKSAEPLQAIEQLVRDAVRQPAERTKLEAALVKLLAPGATFEAQRFACQQLMIIGTDVSLPALTRLLQDEKTVGIACLALSTQRSPKAVETLRNALPATRGQARLQVISALGNHQDAKSVETLAGQARRVEDPAVTHMAIMALSKIDTSQAHAAIAALRRENKPQLARDLAQASLRVAEQLAAGGNRKAALALAGEFLGPDQPANIRRGAFSALVRFERDGGEHRVLATMRGPDPLLKPVAIAAVGTLKSRGASRKFAAELPRLAPTEQAWLIDALATRGDAAARAAIRAAVAAPDQPVRLAAVAALGRLNDPDSAQALCAALAKAPARDERQEIASSLSQLHGAGADRVILREFQLAGGEFRRELMGVVARRGNHAAVPLLLADAASSDAAIAQAAFEALASLAEAGDFSQLLAKLAELKAADARDAAELAVARTMTKVTDPKGRSETLAGTLARTTDLAARCSLLRLMPHCGCANALGALKAALKDGNAQVRDTAVRALVDWPDAAAWGTLTDVCRQPEKPAYRTLALRGLVRLAETGNAKPDAALIARYRQLFGEARGDDERKLVLGALAGAASPDALTLAVDHLSKPAVRAEAALAVKQIAGAIKAQHPKEAQDALRKLQPAKKR